MIVVLAIVLALIALMLLVMGYQQLRRKYYVAAGFSLVIGVGILYVVAMFIALWRQHS